MIRNFKPPLSTGRALPATAFILALMSCGAAEKPVPAPVEETAVAQEPEAPAPIWSPHELERLEYWAQHAPSDALPEADTAPLAMARAANDPAAIDAAASELALDLAQAHLLGAAGQAERKGWHIADSDAAMDVSARLETALEKDDIDGFFSALRPQHPEYAALRKAYASETDPVRRATIARNMERWRWMPLSLGRSYILVNQAAFEASLWREGKREKTWRVIVGKPSTPSPVFTTTVTGVNFNPWWNIPASIVAEMKGRFPASKGYVRTANGWAQKPGPGNALGQVKLVMPNPFSVYMHDTPGKTLFEKDVRAFSHGCIRVGNAIDFATTLLGGKVTPQQVEEILASRNSTTIVLPVRLPVYITYFTAGTLGDGTFAVMPDIYGRDGAVKAPAIPPGYVCTD